MKSIHTIAREFGINKGSLQRAVEAQGLPTTLDNMTEAAQTDILAIAGKLRKGDSTPVKCQSVVGQLAEFNGITVDVMPTTAVTEVKNVDYTLNETLQRLQAAQANIELSKLNLMAMEQNSANAQSALEKLVSVYASQKAQQLKLDIDADTARLRALALTKNAEILGLTEI